MKPSRGTKLAILISTAVTCAIAPPASAARVAVHQVPQVLAGLSRAGRASATSPTARLWVGVSVARPDPAGESQLEHDQYDVRSPEFHRWLTPQTFADRFGVAPATETAVTTWLTHTGATVVSRSSSGDWITLDADVSQLDRLFAVTIGRYSSGGRTFLANDIAPSVPTSLPITAVTGLDTVSRVQQTSQRLPATAARTAASTYRGSLTSRDVRGIYDLPSRDTGQGVTAGVFVSGDVEPIISDLRVAEAVAGYPRVPVHPRYVEPGTVPSYGDSSGDFEWNLDTQAITAMAPGLKQLDLYVAKHNLDTDIVSQFSAWADDPQGPVAMDASFGDCEYSPTNPVTGPLSDGEYGVSLSNGAQVAGDPALAKAALLGRTLFSAAGDNASGCFEIVAPVVGAGQGVTPGPVPIPLWPAISTSAVDVGGTVVTTSAANHAQRVGETTWLYSGGGPSHITAEPDYQKPVAAVDIPCATDLTGAPYVPPVTCRGGPDVAAISGTGATNNGLNGAATRTYQGFLEYVNDAPEPVLGTSVAAPLVAGMWADVEAASAGGLGFANRTFYSLGTNPSTYARDFHDITQSEEVVGDGAYQPRAGWDYVSGFGTLDVAHLIKDADHRLTPVTQSTYPVGAPTRDCTGRINSPKDNAYDLSELTPGLTEDPTTTNQPALDITTGSLTTARNGKSVSVRLSGPALSPTLPTDTTNAIFQVSWVYRDVTYFLDANDMMGKLSYGDGSVAADGTATDVATPHVTGSFAGHVLTMTAPTSEVGSPPIGGALSQPAATVFGEGDTGEGFVFTGADQGATPTAMQQRGQDVIVGCPATHASLTKKTATSPTRVADVLPTTGGSRALMTLAVALLLAATFGVRVARSAERAAR